jgi:hypothetical protein
MEPAQAIRDLEASYDNLKLSLLSKEDASNKEMADDIHLLVRLKALIEEAKLNLMMEGYIK